MLCCPVLFQAHPTDALHCTSYCMYYICIYTCTVFTRLNAAAFITFELAERGGAYSRAAFIISARSYSINFTFASSHGAGGGYFLPVITPEGGSLSLAEMCNLCAIITFARQKQSISFQYLSVSLTV